MAWNHWSQSQNQDPTTGRRGGSRALEAIIPNPKLKLMDHAEASNFQLPTSNIELGNHSLSPSFAVGS